MESVDSDYEGIAEDIVTHLMKKNKTLEKLILAVLNFNSPEDVLTLNTDEEISTFLLNNDTYCSGFEYEITKIGKDQVVLSLAYGT